METEKSIMYKSICTDLIFAAGDLEISDIFEKVRFLVREYENATTSGITATYESALKDTEPDILVR